MFALGRPPRPSPLSTDALGYLILGVAGEGSEQQKVHYV
jgi:hypothetical protein